MIDISNQTGVNIEFYNGSTVKKIDDWMVIKCSMDIFKKKYMNEKFIKLESESDYQEYNKLLKCVKELENNV
jgi:hypothetical protein